MDNHYAITLNQTDVDIIIAALEKALLDGLDRETRESIQSTYDYMVLCLQEGECIY